MGRTFRVGLVGCGRSEMRTRSEFVICRRRWARQGRVGRLEGEESGSTWEMSLGDLDQSLNLFWSGLVLVLMMRGLVMHWVRGWKVPLVYVLNARWVVPHRAAMVRHAVVVGA